MAAAKAVVSVTDNRYIDFDGKYTRVLGTIAIDASPATYTTGGIAMSFAASIIKSGRAPLVVKVIGRNAAALYVYVPGTDNTNGKLKIYSAIGTETTDASAIAAGVSGETQDFEAIWLGQGV